MFGSGHVKFESANRQICKHRYQISSLVFGGDFGSSYIRLGLCRSI